MDEIIQSILRKILDPQQYEIGFAKVEGLLPAGFSQYLSALSLVRKMDDEVIDGIKDGPTQEYYELYAAVNDELDVVVATIVNDLHVSGIAALGVTSQVDEKERNKTYLTTLACPISHKFIATRAGLGWIGKTDLMVTKRFGPRVRLASILLEQPLENYGTSINASQCGSCRVCVKACPASAATGELWDVNIYRDEFFDPFKCRKCCEEVSVGLVPTPGNLAPIICGKCVCVCPR